MKRLAVIGIVLGALAFAGTAQAINGQQAVRQMRLFVAENCYSEPGFRCLGWEVDHCWKLGSRKVRCHAEQEYEHRGNWRECRFNVVAVERRNSSLVDMHFGYTRCYAENGELI